MKSNLLKSTMGQLTEEHLAIKMGRLTPDEEDLEREEE